MENINLILTDRKGGSAKTFFKMTLNSWSKQRAKQNLNYSDHKLKYLFTSDRDRCSTLP